MGKIRRQFIALISSCALVLMLTVCTAQALTIVYSDMRDFPDAENTEQPFRIEKLHKPDLTTLKNDVRIPTTDSFLFPVHSSRWVASVNKIMPLTQPQKDILQQLPISIFIVGTDAVSKQWLYASREKLMDMNAVGYLVECNSAVEFTEVHKLIPTIELLPTNADALSLQFGINQYPVLISTSGITQ